MPTLCKSSLYSTPKMNATVRWEMNNKYSPLSCSHSERNAYYILTNTVNPKFAYQSNYLLLSKTKLRKFSTQFNIFIGNFEKNEWMKTIVMRTYSSLMAWSISSFFSHNKFHCSGEREMPFLPGAISPSFK